MNDETSIRILMVEDVPTDAELAERLLRKAGLDFISHRVDTEREFVDALKDFKPDIIISDYMLPGFDGMKALKISLSYDPLLPFIIFTGSMNEDTAVACMKAGATDYVVKEHNKRLPFAVREALKQKKIQKEKVLAETISKKTGEILIQTEEKYRSIFENAVEGIFQTTAEGKIVSANPSIAKMFGYDSPDNMISSVTSVSNDLYANPDDREKFKNKIALQGKIDNFEVLGRKKDGTTFWMNFNARVVRDNDGNILFYEGTVEDITFRKQAEIEAQQNSRRQQAILHLYRMNYASTGEITAFVVEECIKISGSQLAFVGYVNEDESFMEAHLWSQKAMEMCATEKPLHFPIEKAGIWAEAIRQRRPVVINDYAAPNPDKKGYPEGHVTIKSFLGIPLVEKGRVVLVAGVANKLQDYTETDQNNISLLIEGMWSFLQRRKAEENLSSTLETLRKAMGGIIQVVASTVEAKDPYTAGHQRRVANLARTIAQEMGLSADVVEGIRTAGTIHDIGKISIPSEILAKPTKLMNLEFLLIKGHPRIAYNILKDIEFPWPIAEIVVQHHERLDGSGYPNGLKGNSILLEARIIAVADVVEAISTNRPYRPALGIGPALEEIEKNRGILYDPEVVDVCLKLFRENRFKFE